MALLSTHGKVYVKNLFCSYQNARVTHRHCSSLLYPRPGMSLLACNLATNLKQADTYTPSHHFTFTRRHSSSFSALHPIRTTGTFLGKNQAFRSCGTTDVVRPNLAQHKSILPRHVVRLFRRKRLPRKVPRANHTATRPHSRLRRFHLAAVQRWGYVKTSGLSAPLRAYEAPSVPTLHDPTIIRRPGEVADVATVVRNHWAFPLMGFNSVLEIPVYPFEVLQHQSCRYYRTITLPNDIFGVPIRPDIVFRAWKFYMKAYTGWTERMNLFKWEWPGTRKKHRKQNSGQARMNWRRSPGRWPGVHSNPRHRPRNHRQKLNKKVIFAALKMVLSAKFAQDQLRVVEHFNLTSHKTKHCVTYLRRLVGLRSQRVLLIHGDRVGDVNDNFRWACGGISGIERHTPKTVSVYNLVKSGKVIISRYALEKLIYNIKAYPKQQGWRIRCATPDGNPAPRPKPVPGWNTVWLRKKQQETFMEYGELLKRMKLHWRWSEETKGPTKVWRHDPFTGFRLKEWELKQSKAPWEKWELLNSGTRDALYDKLTPATRSTLPPTDKIPTEDIINRGNMGVLHGSGDLTRQKLITKEDVLRLCL